MLSLDDFQAMPMEEVAQLVYSAGPQVCVFPINGTRRWFRLEHANDADPSMEHYMEVVAGSYMRLFAMLYEHGIDTILSPAFGSELLERGEQYANAALTQGLPMLGRPGFMDFYKQYDVRVRFYGNYRPALDKPIYAPVLDVLGNISKQTSSHTTRRLFFGLFAEDATQQVGNLAVDFNLRENRPPERAELVSLYYGEYIQPATLFIGFEKPAVFDYPLLGLGNESLYFSVAPTPYLTEGGLRKILYDHLYQRNIKDPNWENLPESEAEALRSYYRREQDTILGVGEIFHHTWIHQEDNPLTSTNLHE